MDVSLKQLNYSEKRELSVLLEEYRKELSQNSLDYISPYKYIDDYFSDPNKHPYFIVTNNEIAGFALINLRDTFSNGQKQTISEFYVKPNYRDQEIGEKAIFKIFDFFRGEWVIRVMSDNPAYEFWKKVINEYSKGKYEEILEKDENWDGPVFYLKS